MAIVSGSKPLVDSSDLADVIEPPAWVARVLGGGPSFATDDIAEQPLVIEGEDASLVCVRVRGVRDLEEPGTAERVTQAYRSLFAALKTCRAPHPVRFWNHIPGLHDRVAVHLDRYMAFNAGRFAAMQEWFGGLDQVRRCVATASGIGHSGDDLYVHCLGARGPGAPVENPRQVPAYLYSKRFGPTPPCFARATVAELNARRTLLIGGTASIRGEESVHIGDLEAQIHETLINLRAVIANASGKDERRALELLQDARVYHPRAVDGALLRELCERAFPNVQELEVLRADLCRSELLVEIEGVARLA